MPFFFFKVLAVFLGILRLWTVNPEQGGDGPLHHQGGRVPAREQVDRQERRAEQHFQTISFEPLGLVLLEMGTIPVLFSSLN